MLLRAVGVSLILALGACTSMHEAEPAASVQTAMPMAASAPSPRAACAPAQVTLYFGEQVSSDEPVVTPLLNQFMDQVRACQAAGGEVRSITITTSADPGQNAADSRAQIQRRQDRVRAALVSAGAPADKIGGATAPEAAVMGRRAEITANLY